MMYGFAIALGLTAGAFISLFAPLIMTMLGPAALMAAMGVTMPGRSCSAGQWYSRTHTSYTMS